MNRNSVIKKTLSTSLCLAVSINLSFATFQNWKADISVDFLTFPSSFVCGLGTLLFFFCLTINRRNKCFTEVTIYSLPQVIILTGTLFAGKITYFGEDLSSFAVILFSTLGLIPFCILFVKKLGKSSLLRCLLILYSPTLSYYSAHQWVEWNTRLFAHKVAGIEGWDFEEHEGKWTDYNRFKPEHVIVYHWNPVFRRFASKEFNKLSYPYHSVLPETLYTVEKIDGKLLITDSTIVNWQSSGETCVWPCRR